MARVGPDVCHACCSTANVPDAHGTRFSISSGSVAQLSVVACAEALVRGSLILEDTTSRSSQHWLEQAPCVSTSTRVAAPGPKRVLKNEPICLFKRWALSHQQSPRVSARSLASAAIVWRSAYRTWSLWLSILKVLDSAAQVPHGRPEERDE